MHLRQPQELGEGRVQLLEHGKRDLAARAAAAAHVDGAHVRRRLHRLLRKAKLLEELQRARVRAQRARVVQWLRGRRVNQPYLRRRLKP